MENCYIIVIKSVVFRCVWKCYKKVMLNPKIIYIMLAIDKKNIIFAPETFIITHPF